MADTSFPPPRSADHAWQLLIGSWTATLGTGNSKSISTFRFTIDRKMNRTSFHSAGVMPFPITNERTTEINGVTVKGSNILLTLGATTLGRPGGVMTVRLLAADQLLIEEGPVHTRDKSE
jgi:hypothetical protein